MIDVTTNSIKETYKDPRGKISTKDCNKKNYSQNPKSELLKKMRLIQIS